MRNKIVLLIALVIIAGGLGWGWKMMKKGNTGKWREYRSTTGGFRLDYPEKWEVKEYQTNENFELRVEFVPTSESDRIGQVGLISATVVASPGAGQMMATPEEFADWEKQKTATTNSGIAKYGAGKIGGEKAVILSDQLRDFWVLTAWFRRQDRNYYLGVMGNDSRGKADEDIYKKIANSWKWL